MPNQGSRMLRNNGRGLSRRGCNRGYLRIGPCAGHVISWPNRRIVLYNIVIGRLNACMNVIVRVLWLCWWCAGPHKCRADRFREWLGSQAIITTELSAISRTRHWAHDTKLLIIQQIEQTESLKKY
jgi:hypothetical protein